MVTCPTDKYRLNRNSDVCMCDLIGDRRPWSGTMGQLNVKNEELEAMVKEASGPINFTVFLTMFGEKLKGQFVSPCAFFVVW